MVQSGAVPWHEITPMKTEIRPFQPSDEAEVVQLMMSSAWEKGLNLMHDPASPLVVRERMSSNVRS
jgi:hypothetical protein